MIANWITLIRMPILAVGVIFLYQPAPALRFCAVALIILSVLLDTVDGLVARRTGQTSILGSILDIAADRTTELILWIVFADLDLVPVIIPLIVVTRGVFVDAFRSAAPARGLAPFELMRSRVGRILVKSSWGRASYSVAKISAFFLISLRHGFSASTTPPSVGLVLAGQVAAWAAVALCLVRGIPVLIEAPQVLFRDVSHEHQPSPPRS